ncbi:MAG: hypothetical protein RIT40_1039, partial [Planctomycetota bacterium]
MLRIYALWLLALVVSSGEGAQATALVQAEDQRTSGLALRAYAIGEPMDQLLPLVAGQTPNVSRVIPTLDLEDAELGGLEDVFLTEVEGWLVVPEAGEYTLRLISDDGSELSLDGKLLIDHDGLHGPQPKDARITLSQGEHSLRIRHFETYGGWALKLQWKRPGADSFEIVPSTALACVKGDVKVTAPGFKRVIRPLATTRPGDGEPLQG